MTKRSSPGTQGGPLMHVIAGKAVAFGEALTPEFHAYIEHVGGELCRMGGGAYRGWPALGFRRDGTTTCAWST